MRIAIVLIIVVVLFLYLLNRYYGIQKLFNYSFTINDINVPVSGLLTGNQSASISFSIHIKNASPETIIFKNLIVKLYTINGVEIGETPLDSNNLKTTVLLPMQDYTYTGVINVLINDTVLNLMTSALAGNPVTVNYKLSVKATSFNIPISYSDSFTYKK